MEAFFRKKWTSKTDARLRNFRKKMLKTCEDLDRRNYIEKLQFYNSIAQLKCKSIIKSNLAQKKTATDSYFVRFFTKIFICPILSCYGKIRGVNNLVQDKPSFCR